MYKNWLVRGDCHGSFYWVHELDKERYKPLETAFIVLGDFGVNYYLNKKDEKKKQDGEATQKDNEMLSTMQLVREALARGVQFLGVNLHKSDASAFLPENGKIRMPFNSLPGLGDTAAEKIVETMKENPDIFSVQQLREGSGISKTIVELLRRNHVLDGLTETNQLSLF